MRSLKTRLLLWVCGSAAGVTVAAAVLLFVLARSYHVNQLDHRIQEKARLVASLMEFEGDSIELEFEELDLKDFQATDSRWYLAVWVDSERVYHSPSLEDRELDRPSDTVKTVRWIALPGLPPARGLMWSAHLDRNMAASDTGHLSDLDQRGGINESHLSVTVFVARDASDVLATLRYLAIGLTVVTVTEILLMALILTRVVRDSLRPVDTLARQIQKIEAADLHASVHVAALPQELEPIVSQFNSLLIRLRSAFERERGFCADVAHELRTPLAGLRTILEVTQGRPRDSAEYIEAIDRCRQVVIQTQNLVDYLLQIAKLETGQTISPPEWLDLNAEIRRIWDDLTQKPSGQKNYRCHWRLAEEVRVWTDRVVLEIVLGNLLSNAIDYVDEHGVIEIESRVTTDGVTMVIANSGSQVDSDDANKVCQRFWRGSASRSGSGSHFGLGLALAKRAVEYLGGTLSITTQRNEMFRVTWFLRCKRQ